MTEQRVALVTGAARGIGAATVRTLCAEGFRVVAMDLCQGDGHKLPGVEYALSGPEDLVALERELGGQVAIHIGDVRERADLDEAVELARRRWRRLDVAVAAAAVVLGGRPLWQEPHLDTAWQVNVLGVWNAAAASVPLMLAGPDPAGCRFLAVASAAGTRGLFGLSAYCTVKHAVVGLVRSLAADLVGSGVCAVALAPGATDTAILRATADLYGVTAQRLAQHQLVRELLDPAEIAAAVAYCCTPAGRALNGSVLALDGGFAG